MSYHKVVILTCDVCHAELNPDDKETVPEARKAAKRLYGWKQAWKGKPSYSPMIDICPVCHKAGGWWDT
jgi:hypothetical protein